MHRTLLFRHWFTAFAVLASSAFSASAQSLEIFEPLGINSIGQDVTDAYTVSPDGTSITGLTSVDDVGAKGLRPFIWRSDTGMLVITNFPPGRTGMTAMDVANGGNRAVFRAFQTGTEPDAGFLWTRTNGFHSLGSLTDGHVDPRAISADGKTIVGKAKSVNTPSFIEWEAFRWTSETGLVGLGDIVGAPDEDMFDSHAVGVSADGRIIAGNVRYGGPRLTPVSTIGYHAAARWIDGGQPQMLPRPASAEENFIALAISANGTFIVGHYEFGMDLQPDGTSSDRFVRAYRWSEEHGYDILHEGRWTEGQVGIESFGPADVSDDGMTVVGRLTPQNSASGAAVWTADRGVRMLSDVLTELGVSTAGFTFLNAKSVSADGRVIVGSGTDINGKQRGYRAVLRDLPPRKIIVNSVADRPALSPANCCDTGETLENGEPECTLRAAIEAVNAGCGDRIEFAVPDVAIPKITPQTPLPVINSKVDIDGTTQSGGKVEISGTDSTGICLDVQGGGSIVRGLVINNFTGGDGIGIRLWGGAKNAIVGNYLGTDVSGNVRAVNTYNLVVTNSSGNQIGTTKPGEGNIIGDFVVIEGEASTGNTIVANRIGIGADGTSKIGRTVGIVVVGASGTTIGGASGAANRIGGLSEIQIGVGGASATVIDGNFIGLDVPGIGALGGEIGIAGLSTRLPGGAATSSLIIRSNRIAGVRAGIVLERDKVTGAQVTDNGIGLRFDNSGMLPSGMDADPAKFGIRVDGAPGVQILRNVIAGADMNILIAGKPQFTYIPCEDTDGDGFCDTAAQVGFYSPENPYEDDDAQPQVGGVVVGANAIGVNGGFALPAGAKQRYGVVVYRGASDLQIRNNIVAGHSEGDIWLSDGNRLQLMQNRIGSPDGITRNSRVGVIVDETSDVTIAPSGSFVGNTIGRLKDAAILVRGGATNLLVRGNQIGTGPGGGAAWPNGSGIIAAGPNIIGLKIENNLINGSVTNGVSLDLADKVVLQGNRIGVSSAGLGLPNLVGVVVRNTPVDLLGNTIAHNGQGILIHGDQSALVQGGPLYENGDGAPEAAFSHLDQTIERPLVFIGPKFTSPTGKVVLTFKGIAPSTSGGSVEIEIYGNRAGEKQGRTPLGRRTVQSNDQFTFVLEGEPGSAFETLPEFSATATQNGRTSMLAPVTPVKLEGKPVVTGTTATDISLQWPAAIPFLLERASTPDGPWGPVLTVPMVVDGIATITIPLEGDSQFFRLVLEN